MSISTRSVTPLNDGQLAVLYRVGHLLQGLHFRKAFGHSQTRLADVGESTLSDLRCRLLHQLGLRAKLRTGAGFDELTHDVAAQGHALVLSCDQYADRYAQPVAARHKRFVVRRDQNLFDALLDLSNEIMSTGVSEALSQCTGRIAQFPLTFDQQNMVSELSLYLVALNTLTRYTGLPDFEAALSAMATDQWFVGGYPHDLLVHDRLAIASGMTGFWAARSEYCSTFLSSSDSEPLGIAGGSEGMVDLSCYLRLRKQING